MKIKCTEDEFRMSEQLMLLADIARQLEVVAQMEVDRIQNKQKHIGSLEKKLNNKGVIDWLRGK